MVNGDAREVTTRRTIGPEVAAMLAAARQARGWSLRQAGRRAGITASMIVHLEKARRAPSLRTAEDIITAYELPDYSADLLRSASVADAGRSYDGNWRHGQRAPLRSRSWR